MSLRIYPVNPADRPWGEWLESDLAETKQIDLYNFHETKWYQGYGRFLCLIHFGGDLKDGDKVKAASIDSKWAALDSSVRDNVFWLIYSGGGYWKMASTFPRNIHYLRYEVNRLSLTSDDRTRFQTFCKTVKERDGIGVSIWETLYPTENVHLATLLAILSAEEVVDITLAVDSFISDEDAIGSAHREFIARVKPGDPVSSISTWVLQLRGRNYHALRRQILCVFGGVPD